MVFFSQNEFQLEAMWMIRRDRNKSILYHMRLFYQQTTEINN